MSLRATQIQLNAATATLLTSTAYGRKSLVIRNHDATNAVFVGATSGVTTSTGFRLGPGEAWPFSNISGELYGIASASTPTVGVAEGIGAKLSVPDAGPSDVVWAINPVASNRIFQRGVGTNEKAITLSGSYAGTPSTVQVRIFLISDNSDVVAWQTLDASPSGGAFSGSVTVPSGGPYGYEVRDADTPSEGAVGAGQFFVGALIIGYGQSNMAGMFSTTNSPPSANSATRFFNGSSWVAVPSANGVRELLNALATATGIPWGAINAAVSGASSGHFVEGQGGFAGLAAQLNIVGDAEFVIWRQGEGDADGGVITPATYAARLDEIHEDIANYVGRTKAQIPFITGSLSTYGGSQAGISDNEWWQVQTAHVLASETYPNIHYSHSIMDAVRTDSFHYDGASQGKAGRRYAQSILVLLGEETNHPAWFITGVAAINTITTDVTVAHSMGTDFTPSSGITGFIVSDDAWATSETATGARTGATTIRLTHAALSASEDRLVRYQYGTAPDVSAPVLDNSSLAAPLNHSANQVAEVQDLQPPAMTSSAALDIDENETFVATLTATRPSTFAIGGTDGALFEIQNDNELHFIDPPDFESPGDANTDNDYVITITPTAIDDSEAGSAQNVTVTVNDIVDGAASYAFAGDLRQTGSGHVVSGSFDLGSAASDRYVLIGCSVQNQDPDPVVVANGVTLAKLDWDSVGSNATGFYGGLVTSGNGSLACSVTFTSATFEIKVMHVWVLRGLNSTTHKQLVRQATQSNDLSIPVEADDFLFFIQHSSEAPPSNLNSSTEVPARSQATSGGNAQNADWTIASTNAAFSVECSSGSGSGQKSAITFA